MIRSMLLAALPALCLMGTPALAQSFNEAQKAEIGAFVKDYLLKNPEIVRDAMIELDRREKEAERIAQKQALQTYKKALFEDPDAIAVGNPNGDVTLVEFFDYNCGYCKRSVLDVQEMIKKDSKLKVLLKDFPILGPDSVEASKIALAVKAELKGERYFEYHLKLMSTRGRVGKERALDVAKEMGLNPIKIAAAAEAATIQAQIKRTMDVAEALGVNGTPAFIIGDEIVAGAVGVGPLQSAAASLRTCGKATC
jgi:protein-disulfide isomerase